MKYTVQVRIQGRDYTLRSQQSQEQVQMVADFVEQKLDEMAAGRSVDTRDLTVLTLLNLAGQYLQLLDERDQQSGALESRLAELVSRVEQVVSG